ncbi:interleukin-6 receptor subunit beta-like isoform X3 [Leucoraja erinacea]|uniref:interleukin-6 receptor subunit beta-like isoform X3 n=1 Tax=Leucoraja erinaceus TaxID=7782 RepID=UPI002456452C|nr:interleukin-6 receptor subunit beta-like isoform X3 [Leucoraja erinacea]
MRGTIRIVCELLLTAVLLNQHSNQTDMFCFRVDKDSEVICTWSPIHNTWKTTEYMFHLEMKSSSVHSNKPLRIPTLLPSVALERKILSAGKCYVAWVEVNNTQLTSLEFIIEDIVKPQPPVSVSAKTDGPTNIAIDWTKPANLDQFVSMQYELQYRLAGQQNWSEVSDDEVGVHAVGYVLEDLQPFTKYEFRVRCGREGETNQKLWSDWSAVTGAMTEEAKPVGVLDVWFMQGGPGSITLLWKPLEQHQARGKIQRYSVNYTLRLPDGEIMSRANITAYRNITLSETTQLVNVSAYNSVGATDPATLNLVQDQLPVLNITVLNYNDQVRVCWVTSAKTMLGFVVEWVNMNLPENPPEWKKIPALDECMDLKHDVLQAWIPYNVSVYTQYQIGLGRPVSTIIYTKEDVPRTGPQVSIYNISQTSATLLWENVPLSLRRGFILYYTLYYVKNPQEDWQKVPNISSALNSFTLLNLEPASTYTIRMAACTRIGEGTKGPHLKLKTGGNVASHIIPWKHSILVLVTLVVIVLCIIGICCFHQRLKRLVSMLIPQWCCQRIPDPKIIRALLQQNHTTPKHFTMIESDPEIIKVEEIIPEIMMQLPLEIRKSSNTEDMFRPNSPTLTEANSSKSEDLFWPSTPTREVDNSPQVSIHSHKEFALKPISTEFPRAGRTCNISGYEKHFIPSAEQLLEDEWQLDNKAQWLGLVESQQ